MPACRRPHLEDRINTFLVQQAATTGGGPQQAALQASAAAAYGRLHVRSHEEAVAAG